MTPTIDDHRDPIAVLAARSGFSVEAVATMRDAVSRGGGRMAQFDHREFGGPGQWMHGGLVMLGDSDDRTLRLRVDALCEALASADDAQRDAVPPADDAYRDAVPPTDRPPSTAAGSDPFVALEKLAALHARGIVDDAEYAAKKAELLRRI